jgi:hypothetical protein
MADLTPNTGVPTMESMSFSAAAMLYKMYLRDLLIEKIDNPEHQYDDHLLAATDGAFGLIPPWAG